MNTYLISSLVNNMGRVRQYNYVVCSIYPKYKVDEETGICTARVKKILLNIDEYDLAILTPYIEDGQIYVHFIENTSFSEIKKFKTDSEALLYFELEKRL